MWFTVSYCESTRVGLQFQYHDQYSIVTQALVLAPENVHISLMNTGETVLNCTEIFKLKESKGMGTCMCGYFVCVELEPVCVWLLILIEHVVI